MAKVKSYELTDEEHNQMCEYIERGFRDSLRKFLEGITSKSSDQDKIILSSKVFHPDPTSNRMAPLVLAAMEGRVNILQLFLDVFKDIIDINHGSFMTYPDQLLFEHVRVSGFKTRSLTALNAACVGGFTDIVKTLAEAGANLNKPDHFGYSPLCNAARYGNAPAIELLLSKGANASHRTHDGFTPMHLAALHGQEEVVKAMLSKLIDPLFPKAYPQADTTEIPCPMYLAAARGWQPVVDQFTSQATCPSYCKIDAKLLLGAASRMFWTNIKDDSMQSIIDLWVEARQMKDTRPLTALSTPVESYLYRDEIVSESKLKELMTNSNVEEESLYQCLIIHERCMGSINSYNWIFLASIKMFQRRHYKEAEDLWKRAMMLHYELAKQKVGFQYWQHDLKGSVEYMVQFTSAIETMIKDGYIPAWAEYVQYALQQLKMSILTNLQTNTLDISNGVLKIYYCLLQILSCWILTENGPYDPESGFETSNTFSDALARNGQSFVDTAGVLTQSNLLHIAIYPAAGLKISRATHWQSAKRLPGLVKALIDWGAINSIDDIAYGERPLHITARLPNKVVRQSVIKILLNSDAHPDALNKNGKTAEEVLKESYPNDVSPFPAVAKLSCLAAGVICNSRVHVPSKLSNKLNFVIKMHSTSLNGDAVTETNWITLPVY